MFGYLPGDIEEKMSPWMQPIYDNVEFLMGLSQKDKKSGRSYHELLDMGIVEIEPLTYIRGRSIPNQYMIVDEAQNLTPHEAKTILTRAGDNTKISYTPYNGVVGNYRTIWGSGIFDVWFGADSGLLRHFTSAGLLTEQPFTTANIYSIWGSDLTNIYAVGDAGTMFRFDGTQWSPVNSGTRNRLNSIWGRSATDVWAAGTFGSVLHSAQK